MERNGLQSAMAAGMSISNGFHIQALCFIVAASKVVTSLTLHTSSIHHGPGCCQCQATTPTGHRTHRSGFIQAKAQFAVHGGITQQKTMFDYIVTGLSSDIMVEVHNLAPEEEPYNKLKAALLKCMGLSEQ